MPGRLSSPACLTVICFLSCWLRLTGAQVHTDEVADTVQYGRLDSDITLNCGNAQNGTPVLWLLNRSSALPPHRLSSNGSLLLLAAAPSAQGLYSCYHGHRHALLHSLTLRLGHPPGLLSISCQVPNHTHVRCSWVDSVTTFLPAVYNASLRGNGPDWTPCIVDSTHKHCDVPCLAFWQTVHTLGVTETNGLGSQTTWGRFKFSELLRPNPPDGVSVRQVEGHATRLAVSWSLPTSWPRYDGFPLLFHIRYRPQGSMYWSEYYSEHSPVEILDALAGHLHQVQVRARDELDSESQWSEWSPLVVVRPWEAATPEAPPTDDDPFDPFDGRAETSTAKSHTPGSEEDEGGLGLLVLLGIFSLVVLATVLSLVFVVWSRQRRRHHVTMQELASVVKMKAMPI